MMGTSVIFGGTGFIGTHLAQHLLQQHQKNRIILVDIQKPRGAPYASILQQGLATGRARFVSHDVRQPVPSELCGEPVDTVYNLAAIHREPGHRPEEYFETNLAGAENVCTWASGRGVRKIVFTSSISPYGPSESQKNEFSLTVPETAYGSSKLAAEKIHLGWASGSVGRNLLILRPGVVFGPGEEGNVTRLLRSVVRGYFIYMGNRETRKAAVYVKDLCSVMQFGLKVTEQQELSSLLLNVSLDPPPTMEEFIRTIQHVTDIRRPILSVSRGIILASSYPIAAVASLFGIRQPISPVRVRKLFRSTNIEALTLRKLGYPYRYTLRSAFEDWKADAPEDFA
jgi:nucleoside-diphosphate-sugar epimerase